MPFNIQGPEIIILLVIALLVLGPGKLPEVGAALGKSIREFRKAASDVKESVNVAPVAAEPARLDAPAVAPIAPAAPVATVAQAATEPSAEAPASSKPESPAS